MYKKNFYLNEHFEHLNESDFSCNIHKNQYPYSHKESNLHVCAITMMMRMTLCALESNIPYGRGHRNIIYSLLLYIHIAYPNISIYSNEIRGFRMTCIRQSCEHFISETEITKYEIWFFVFHILPTNKSEWLFIHPSLRPSTSFASFARRGSVCHSFPPRCSSVWMSVCVCVCVSLTRWPDKWMQNGFSIR